MKGLAERTCLNSMLRNSSGSEERERKVLCQHYQYFSVSSAVNHSLSELLYPLYTEKEGVTSLLLSDPSHPPQSVQLMPQLLHWLIAENSIPASHVYTLLREEGGRDTVTHFLRG